MLVQCRKLPRGKAWVPMPTSTHSCNQRQAALCLHPRKFKAELPRGPNDMIRTAPSTVLEYPQYSINIGTETNSKFQSHHFPPVVKIINSNNPLPCCLGALTTCYTLEFTELNTYLFQVKLSTNIYCLSTLVENKTVDFPLTLQEGRSPNAFLEMCLLVFCCFVIVVKAESIHVTQGGFKLKTLLPQLLQCWDYRYIIKLIL